MFAFASSLLKLASMNNTVTLTPDLSVPGYAAQKVLSESQREREGLRPHRPRTTPGSP